MVTNVNMYIWTIKSVYKALQDNYEDKVVSAN